MKRLIATIIYQTSSRKGNPHQSSIYTIQLLPCDVIDIFLFTESDFTTPVTFEPIKQLLVKFFECFLITKGYIITNLQSKILILGVPQISEGLYYKISFLTHSTFLSLLIVTFLPMTSSQFLPKIEF